jgi:NDP-sugar pyrophosphorylase family protein
MVKLHKTKKGICTIGLVKTETPWSFGVVELKGDQIINFVEKPKKGEEPSNLISTGIYVMEPKILNFIGAEFFDSTGMIFPYLLKKEQKLFGFKTDAFWVDVGKPESYLEATSHILKTKGVKNCVDKSVKIGDGTKILNNVVVLAGTTIGKNCLIKNSIIFNNNKIGDNCEIVNAIIDEDCKIKSNSKISKVLGKGSIV